MNGLRRLYRLLALLLLALAGLLIQLLAFPWLSEPARRRTIRRWSRLLLACCGIRLELRDGGEAQGHALPKIAPGRMLVANHQSWLDIFAINAVTASAFVAKAELRRWPLVGWLVAMAGTVFIERGRRSAVRAVINELEARIRGGYPVAIFPEATTHVGPELLTFHANLFEAAIATRTDVIPVAVEYRTPAGAPGEAAHYVGDTTFAASLWRILAEPALIVRVTVLSPIPADAAQRHALAREARLRIGAALSAPAAGSGSETAAGPPDASH